ncbi:molybdopterin-dependent oxidoreductase [Nocardia neocaledoniensis]|uniref:molybdopterin-dependent oxidoreductase n=1 Tax=Nocardia neocaledoniensis TaxID=236511 RepID=UPI002458274F|nr:molybdopterin-dependent oxidoreductase [Nocardia neocaledoniensis]
MALPPGQRAIDGFPRFGTHLHHPPPPIPAEPTLELGGAVAEPLTFTLDEFATLPRRELLADFHCVAGWSATGLRWAGVPFAELYRARIEPMRTGVISHVVFEGLDGFQSVVLLEDALGEDVLIADRLDGQPLNSDHGAPIRLVSPSQYGFVNTKHLCRITFHTSQPHDPDRFSPLAGHRRARVWEEERHRYLPGRLVRPIYHRLIEPIRRASAKGSTAP